jgi:ubiquinone/menaquinone biosynthesis C-methylase UbiE
VTPPLLRCVHAPSWVGVESCSICSICISVRPSPAFSAALPVDDASVHFLVCRAAFKNFAEPVKALAEFRRVLRPGGKALLIDMRRDVPIGEIRQYVQGLGVGLLNRWFMMFAFRNMLIKRAYHLYEIVAMAREAGWADPRMDPSPMGFEAWMTK